MANTSKQQRPVGRPSDYDPAYCDKVIKWGEQGKSRMWIAAELETTKPTLTAWETKYPEFLSAMGRARAKAQQWWEDAGQKGLTEQPFNAAVWSRSMAARFPEEWRENSRTELTGANGGPIEHDDVNARDAFARRIAGVASRIRAPEADSKPNGQAVH